MQEKYIEKIKLTALSLGLVILMYGLLGPVEIYGANRVDFDFMLGDFIFQFLCMSLILWVLGTVLISLLPNNLHILVNAFLCGFGVISYIQNMFMNIKIAQDDGSAMNWQELESYSRINFMIYITVFIFLVIAILFFKNYTRKIIKGISTFLILIQSVALISIIFSIQTSGEKVSHYILSPQNEYQLASGDNIIVLMIDSVGVADFNDIYSRHPELLDDLNDFTWFKKADSGFIKTYPSMIHMLTGMDIDNTIERADWFRKAWNSDNTVRFFNELHENGYSCNIYAGEQTYIYGNADNYVGKIDNLEEATPTINYKLMFSLLEKYTVYRYLPYILKPRFEVNLVHYKDVVIYDRVEVINNNNNAEYYENLVKKGLSVEDGIDNKFVIQHLQGMHRPFNIDENCNCIDERDGSKEKSLLGTFILLDEAV